MFTAARKSHFASLRTTYNCHSTSFLGYSEREQTSVFGDTQDALFPQCWLTPWRHIRDWTLCDKVLANNTHLLPPKSDLVASLRSPAFVTADLREVPLPLFNFYTLSGSFQQQLPQFTSLCCCGVGCAPGVGAITQAAGRKQFPKAISVTPLSFAHEVLLNF